jgi:hypothetical protein
MADESKAFEWNFAKQKNCSVYENITFCSSPRISDA